MMAMMLILVQPLYLEEVDQASYVAPPLSRLLEGYVESC